MASLDETVDLQMGTPMEDQLSGTKRDVDLTLRCHINGHPHILAGIEVKAHTRPLDIEHVEQLIIKLTDIGLTGPSRAIVSASGYSNAATKKARAHGVQLFSLQPWSDRLKNLRLPLHGENAFKLIENYWETGPHVHIEVDRPNDTPPFDSKGTRVLIEERDGSFAERDLDVLARNAVKAVEQAAAAAFEPSSELSIRGMEIRQRQNLQNQVHVIHAGIKLPVKWLDVSGIYAQEIKDGRDSLRYLVREDPFEVLVSCSVRSMRDGTLTVIACDQSTGRLVPHSISVEDRNRRKIYALPLDRQTNKHRVNLIITTKPNST